MRNPSKTAAKAAVTGEVRPIASKGYLDNGSYTTGESEAESFWWWFERGLLKSEPDALFQKLMTVKSEDELRGFAVRLLELMHQESCDGEV